MPKTTISPYSTLKTQITELLQQAREQVVKNINTTMVLTYWNLGKYIVEYEQNGSDRAEYGTELLKHLSNDLTQAFGKGFSPRTLYKFKQFFLTFPDFACSAGEIQNIGRGHITRIMSLKNPDEQQFFIIESAKEQRSLRELDRQINSALYERLMLSKDKKGIMQLAKKGEIIETPKDIIRQPYILEFLGLEPHHKYTEQELEVAIINNLQMFLLEMGKGFSFVARQKRIKLDIDNFYIDLVFYNRILHCHLLIDLKIGKVTHQDMGQMQMYVNYYDREIKLPDENPTIGLILCKEQNDLVLKYTLTPDQEHIFTKEYKLYLPTKEELQRYFNNHLNFEDEEEK